MISVPAGVRILLATRPVDFRRGAHALAALAAETLGESPYSGTVLVFRAKRSDRVKILLGTAARLGVRVREGTFKPVFPVRQRQRGLDREAGEHRS